MEIVKIGIDDVTMAKVNMRSHNEKQLEEIRKSVEMFGQFRPIVVDENHEILAGNGLWEAMKLAGKEEIEVYRMPNLTKAEKTKLMIADNKTYELGAMNFDNLEKLLKELAFEGDYNVPGYDSDILEELLATDEETDSIIQSYGDLTSETVERIEGEGQSRGKPPEEQEVELNPDKVKVKQDSPEDRARPYTVCPNCGETIWL